MFAAVRFICTLHSFPHSVDVFLLTFSLLSVLFVLFWRIFSLQTAHNFTFVATFVRTIVVVFSIALFDNSYHAITFIALLVDVDYFHVFPIIFATQVRVAVQIYKSDIFQYILFNI